MFNVFTKVIRDLLMREIESSCNKSLIEKASRHEKSISVRNFLSFDKINRDFGIKKEKRFAKNGSFRDF